LNAAASCAAIRAGLTNPFETRFMASSGEWIMAHQVPLELLQGRSKLAVMTGLCVRECLAQAEMADWRSVPLLVCLAEEDRPGRPEQLDTRIIREVEQCVEATFHPQLSAIIPHGRVSVFVALDRARDILSRGAADQVLIAAVDSMLPGPTLTAMESAGRLLTSENTNGFIPGEAASAVVVGRATRGGSLLLCEGLGFGVERSTIHSEEPFRAEGLTLAIKAALQDAGCQMHDVDFRITDNSGERYYFKEATLALSRTLRRRKAEFDIWHPADCIGEVGAAIGPASLVVALTACRKSYSPGSRILLHGSNDSGERGAALLRYERAS
jgi:3-oxoacyl-[acyl-carrier-protein] synthase-1